MNPAIKILLVDDEEAFTDVVSALLTAQGFKVEVANDGRSALNQIRSASFDLVITDLNMPLLDGIQLIRQVRAFAKDQRFMVVTGYPSQESYQEAFEMGVLKYISKPFLPDRFINIVKESLNYSQ
ncbi:response regulator [candidate division WOR-3 bacterium]|uniref:Response regulator n=1 Tax=candidate division WOR-3 bacterium TaxID=2052148 RepID=A0A9D5K7I8_UNCW3|nr:response regulator [candidate division WOR-3 bacterium]MBD3363728.1 response regulator [candidate division WOR-3 bacterium]